jgi:hypothetical protein
VNHLQTADPAVQAFAIAVLGQAYTAFPTKLAAPGGQDLSDGVDMLLGNIASSLANTPGGFDALYAVAKQRFPDESLPHRDLFMKADPESFGPTMKIARLLLEPPHKQA